MSLALDETTLGLIATGRLYGYQILACFRDPTQLGRVWKFNPSQIYAALKRLEAAQFIAGRAVISALGPARTEFRLSRAGDERLLAWLHDPHPSPSIRRVRVEFLSRLFIARELNLPTDAIVARQWTACLRERDRLAQMQFAPGIEQVAADFVIEQLEAVLRWLPRCDRAGQADRSLTGHADD